MTASHRAADRAALPRLPIRRAALAIAAGVGAFGLVAASAASLGTLTNQKVAATAGAVVACDTDGVTAAFDTAYDAGSSGFYRVSAVNLSDINAACSGQAVKVTLVGASNASLAEVSGSADGSGALTLAVGGAISAADLVRLAVVISGS